MLQALVVDGSLLLLIGKCLHVGVLDGEEYSERDQGTTPRAGYGKLSITRPEGVGGSVQKSGNDLAAPVDTCQ